MAIGKMALGSGGGSNYTVETLEVEQGVKITDSNSKITVTFSHTFANNPVVHCMIPASSGTIFLPVITALSTTGFTCVMKKVDGSLLGANQTIYWVAVCGEQY